ncbi:Uu.00g032920.m01.CDS01 [Anthostomella pinea]|uniref:Uu.00g032920.m01.CDS01 n=1 Tax=Anthostomella pinea TaxID=933095 RepID=A0AAI8V8M0_9PEZI|nr:Uu.00g032920.m01.CDS01 [Anthostomella pinea]
MPIAKLLVFGATGATGRIIVERAPELGWKVTVCGKRTLQEQAKNEAITTVEGPLDDEETLRTAIAGQDAMISVFGPSNPRASTAIFIPSYKLILSTMKSEGVRRITARSTFSVPDAKDKSSLLRWFLVTVLWAVAHKVWQTVIGIAKVFDEEGDGVDWTLFRVGFLANGPRSSVVDGYVGDGTVGCPQPKILHTAAKAMDEFMSSKSSDIAVRDVWHATGLRYANHGSLIAAGTQSPPRPSDHEISRWRKWMYTKDLFTQEGTNFTGDTPGSSFDAGTPAFLSLTTGIQSLGIESSPATQSMDGVSVDSVTDLLFSG